jgi:asparaginyl-tRNA synthetase
MSYIEIQGKLVKSIGSEQLVEISTTSPSQVKIIGECDPQSFPLHKQELSLDYIRDYPHLKCLTDTVSAFTRIKSVAFSKIVQILTVQEGFQWIQTPIIVSSDCEGAGEAFSVQAPNCKDYFKKSASLTVSGQLHVEPYAIALGKAFVFGPSFRAEKSLTRRHLSEFWMLEPEMRDFDLEQMIEFIDSFMRQIISEIIKECRQDLLFCQDKFQEGLLDTLDSISQTKFKTITYTDAIQVLKESKRDFEKVVEWGIDLGADMECYICEEHFEQVPVFITHYPKKIKSFYMYQSDEDTVACCDLLFPGIGEVVGGSQREHRYELLRETLKERKMDEKEYKWYMETRKYSSAPHSGFGLGFDRFLRYITGAPTISDLTPFSVRYKHMYS